MFHGSIVAFKEAVVDRRRVQELRSKCGDDFAILSGDDASCGQAMKFGANGAISVAANVAPVHMRRLCEAALGGDQPQTRRINRELSELFRALAIETNPIPVKWALFEMGLIGPHIRLPLARLEKEYRERVRQCLHGMDLIPS